MSHQTSVDQLEAERELRYAYARMQQAELELNASVWCTGDRETAAAALDAMLRLRHTLQPMIAEFVDGYGWDALIRARAGIRPLAEDGVPLLQVAFDDARTTEATS